LNIKQNAFASGEKTKKKKRKRKPFFIYFTNYFLQTTSALEVIIFWWENLELKNNRLTFKTKIVSKRALC
jgi:hypothetical protein